jgi:8-oxo-dGTP pyrophosphatase MutT (NUDIX family)
MAKEYSVYVGSRRIVLTEQFEEHLKSSEGLFIKYGEPDELTKLLVFFHTSPNIQNLILFGQDVEFMFNDLCNHYVIVDAAGGLVHNMNDEFLLIKRNDHWDLPKGKGERGENDEQTALREVSEECGITNISIEKPLITTFHTYTLGEKRVLKKTRWFNMIYTGSENLAPQEVENITEARWVTRNDLKKYLNGAYCTVKDVFQSAGIT